MLEYVHDNQDHQIPIPQTHILAAIRLFNCQRAAYKKRFAASDLAIWLKTLSPNQRKERNDNAKSDLVKRVLTAS